MKPVAEEKRQHSSKSKNVEYLEELMAQPGADRGAVYEAFQRLREADLYGLGLNAYRMNLLSLFGEKWSWEKIDATARQAAVNKAWRGWEHYHDLATHAKNPRLYFDHFPTHQITDLLDKGRGLVLVFFHQGHFRYIVTDLMCAAKVEFTVALATDAFNDYESSRRISVDAPLWKYFKYVNVERPGGALTLARSLAQGGCVTALLDGNTGIDGPRGGDRRTIVDILGCKAQVKDGMIRMAARFGSPILPIFAPTIDGVPTCSCGPVIDPGRPLRGANADVFVAEALKELYGHFEDNIQSFAHEWDGCDLFHQWRLPAQESVLPLAEVETLLMQDLQNGKRLVRNKRRVVELRRGEEILWTDAHTLKCYRVPREASDFADALNDRDGVNLQWLNECAEPQRELIKQLSFKFASVFAIETR